MVSISAFQMTFKVFSLTLIAATNTFWLALWLSLDMLVYLSYKLLRRDFVYFVAGPKGVAKYFISFVARVIVKILVDFTALLNGRVATEMGGCYFSFNLVTSICSCWVAAHVYGRYNNGGEDKLSGSIMYTFIGVLQAAWFAAMTIFFATIKPKYLRTFYTATTARTLLRERFEGRLNDDEKRMSIVKTHEDLWKEIRDDVKDYSLKMWMLWEQRKPGWLDDNFKMHVPDDFIPEENLQELKKKHGGQRRRSSLGALEQRKPS